MGGLFALVGFLVAYGAVGGMDNDGPLLMLVPIAIVGLALMAVGVSMMNSKEWR